MDRSFIPFYNIRMLSYCIKAYLQSGPKSLKAATWYKWNWQRRNFLVSSHQLTVNRDSTKHVRHQKPSKLKQYLLGRYAVYLEKLQDSLANEMPDTARMLRLFSKGLQEYIIDVTIVTKVMVKLTLPRYRLENMSWKEICAWYFMPWEMVKVLPVLLLSAIPAGQYVFLPVAFWFPKTMLSYHFWDWDQRINFGVEDLKRRLFNARPLFRSVQNRVEDIACTNEKDNCLNLLHALGSGLHLSNKEIFSLIQLFHGHPYSLDYMYSYHVKALMRLHGLSLLIPRRRVRLRDHAKRLHTLDSAITREGLQSFSDEQIKNMLIFRGLNPIGLSQDDIVEYIKNWLSISISLGNSTNYSLLLHLPLFMTYNHPRNLELIYK